MLTSKSCSEEGLEDATALLLQLSRGSAHICETVLQLLLEGARELGLVVCEHIATLMCELRQQNRNQAREGATSSRGAVTQNGDVEVGGSCTSYSGVDAGYDGTSSSKPGTSTSQRGILQDR